MKFKQKNISLNEVDYCKKCVVSNQRPRITFDENMICSACNFSEYKKTVDWDKREKELEILCNKFRSKDGRWDVIVPSSGGKDSSYVAYRLKKDYGMTPLTVTWSPQIQTNIGKKNLENFIQSGFDNLRGFPNGEINKKLAKTAFEEFGDHYLPNIYGIMNFPVHVAIKYKIPLVFYGEDGEVEYGGSLERYDKPELDLEYTHKTKFTSYSPNFWKKFGFSDKDLQFYQPPSIKELRDSKIHIHYFSYYENWKPERNYKIAKKYLKFKPLSTRSQGTFTNFAQIDEATYDFHYYMQFIKFGFGRATSDASHQIRDGLITRDKGVDLVHKYDGEFPNKYEKEFLEYLSIKKTHFNKILDKFRNPIIWKKNKTKWEIKHQVSKL